MYVFSLYALHMFFPRTRLCICMPPVWGENKPKVGARGVIIYTHTYTGLNCMGPLTWEIFFSSKYYSTTQPMAGWFHRCRETVGTEGWLLSYTRILTVNGQRPYASVLFKGGLYATEHFWASFLPWKLLLLLPVSSTWKAPPPPPCLFYLESSFSFKMQAKKTETFLDRTSSLSFMRGSGILSNIYRTVL